MRADIERQAEDLATVTRLTRPTASEVPTIRFVQASELLSQPAPAHWLVRHVLLCGSMTTLIGAPGSFKSNIALDLAASIATGIEWHGRQTRQGAVFFLAGEGNHGIARRLKAWTIVRSDALATAPLFISTGAIGLIEPLNAAAVAAEAQRLANATGAKPELIVVDTLARNFGIGDENSAADMGKFITNLDTHLRELFDCGVLIVHHSGVMDSGRGRGSSALRAAVDTEIVCERTERTVVVRCTKSKDAVEFEPIAFEARIVDLAWVGEDGLAETSFVMNPTTIEPAAAKAIGLGDNQRRALEVLRTLYEEQRATLSAAGHDPVHALVLIADWRTRSNIARNRFAEAQGGLESRHLIAVSHPHVRLL